MGNSPKTFVCGLSAAFVCLKEPGEGADSDDRAREGRLLKGSEGRVGPGRSGRLSVSNNVLILIRSNNDRGPDKVEA